MIKVLTYNEIDQGEWSRLVQTSATGTWFQTPEAYEFFASQPKLFKPFLVGVICDPAGAQTLLRGVCVGYVTVERNPIKQYFTRRAIIIGGPALADDASSEEVETLMIAVRNQFKILDLRFKILNSPIFIETRNFNDYSKWRNAFEHCGGHPRRRPLLPFRWKDVPGAKIHIKKSKCKSFGLGVGFTMGFSAIYAFWASKWHKKKKEHVFSYSFLYHTIFF